ncbi:MAG: DegV family protein [Syntrophomonadaceae bacterium]|jgi:DegV family protein with EDD domain|nr:DegV family protein [Syntrophomonadaceae bacterium]
MAVKIITDTSCDLPLELLNQYNIEMIPLKVTFDDQDTYLDRFEISPSEFVIKMKRSKTLPKTSAPDPQTFITSFEKGLKEAEEIIFVSLSSALSSTYQTALMASEMIGGKNIQVFDSLTASLGTGIAAIKATYMAAQGLTANAIVEHLNTIRKTREVLFTLDTLENVVRGGRLSSFQGMAGTLLNIKPILRGNSDGVPVVVEKVRGRNKAIHRLVSMLGELQGDTVREKLIGISHVSCPEEAQKLAQAIKEMYSPKKEIIISEMGATLGTYAGVGGLMINV